MNQSKALWVLRSSKGQIRGPFDTQAILLMIREGRMSGDEMIAKYPGGNWVSISREPEFYDHLLKALQSNTDEAAKNKSSPRPQDDETILTPPPEESYKPKLERTQSETRTSTQTRTETSSSADLPPRAKSSKEPPVIELSNVKKIERKKKAQKAKRPLVGLVVVLFVGVIALFWPSEERGSKVRLIMPKKGEETLSAEEIKNKARQALGDIMLDTVESYIQAQNKLVTLVEGSPRNLPGRALLCLVYKELWPFSYQDQRDLKTLTEFSQATKNLNLIGTHGQVCEAVKLLAMGRIKEARSVVDNMLDNPDDLSFLSIIYLIKGELLQFDGDNVNALAFFKQASEKGKEWLKPRASLALLQAQTNQYPEAYENFQLNLKMNPNHKVSKLGMGIVLYKGFQKNEEAFQWLKSGLDMKELAPRDLEAEAYFVLANLALQREDKELAHQAAEKAFERNPQNEKIKELLVRLGGLEKLKLPQSQKSELMFLGDQYARQGDCFSAQAQYKTAFEMDPQNGTAAMKAAKCLWQLHQSNEAIEWLKKAIKADPKLVTAYVLQADYLSKRYDFQAATQILLAAKRVSPNSYEVQRGFAQVEFRKNNLEGALQYGQRALTMYQGDVETLMLLSQANIFLARRILPGTSKETERRDQAIKDATKYALKAIEIDGSNVEVNRNYAMIMSMTMGVDAGIKILQDLIKKYSFSHEYRVALGDLLRTEQRYSEAQKIYEQVVDADPKNKEAFLGLGDCYRAQKETTKSLKAFLEASAIDPSDGQPIFEIGKLYLDTQRFDEAVKYFQRVSKINPNYPRTNYFIGKAAFAAGAFDLAEEAVKQEKKNNPYVSDSYILSAEMHMARRQYNECASEYSQAIKLRPQPAEVYVRASQCYRLGGSLEVAEDMLAIAATRESGYAEIYREQGAIYTTKGDQKASIKAYCLYLELSPNAPDKLEVEAQLNRLGFRSQDCNN